MSNKFFILVFLDVFYLKLAKKPGNIPVKYYNLKNFYGCIKIFQTIYLLSGVLHLFL